MTKEEKAVVRAAMRLFGNGIQCVSEPGTKPWRYAIGLMRACARLAKRRGKK